MSSSREHSPAQTEPAPRRWSPGRVTATFVWLIDAFLPEEPTPSLFLRRRGRLLVITSLAFFYISLVFGVQMVAVGTYPTTSIVAMFTGCIFTLLNPYLLRVTGSTALPGILLCSEVLAIAIFQAQADLGLSDPVLIWMLVVPWLAAFLVGPRFGFVFSGLVIVVLGVFYRLTVIEGHPFPNFSGDAEAWQFYFLCCSGVALFTGMLGWFYESQTMRNLREADQELSSIQAALHRSNQRADAILDSITDGFFALDRSWRFTYLNRQAEQMIGRARTDLLGTEAWNHFSDYVGSDVAGAFDMVQRRGIATRFEAFYVPQKRWLDVHIYPFPEGYSIYFSDVTERKEYEERLIEARDKAEELVRLKTAMLSNMSHEIRTPLTGILGFANILAQETSGNHQEFAQLIEENGQRLKETLNSVLDLARLESGAIACNPERVDVLAEVHKVVRLLDVLAVERGLYLRVERNVQDTSAELDRTFLHRVLHNLVGNAIKFTDVGGVSTTVEGDDETIQIRISDTGIGISEAFLPRIFEEFRQESHGTERTHNGTGLGLTITQRLVHTMGGSIEVESEKHVGTTFTVRLPRRVAVRPQPAAPRTTGLASQS